MKLKIWKNSTQVTTTLDGNIEDTVIKISYLEDFVFLLTNKFVVHFAKIGNCNNETQLHLRNFAINVIDIVCDNNNLYIVNESGAVRKISLHALKENTILDETAQILDISTKIKKVSAGNYGVFFISDENNLWAMGNMPQININSVEPKRVSFFDGKTIIDVVVGLNFAVALVCNNKYMLESENVIDDDINRSVFTSPCPSLTSTISSSNSANNFQINMMQDVEHTDIKNKKPLKSESENVDKKAIFGNTARDFLTKQFTWISFSEDYLTECTEAPTRMLKQNVSNVANLVYEGVKTVGDKVVTLSRHVSGSSETNENLEPYNIVCNDDFKQIMSNLKSTEICDEFPWSSSAETSEKDSSECKISDHTNFVIECGNNALNTEVWTWGGEEYGQLGVGDEIKRDRPNLVNKFTGLGIQKISCGDYHVAALTLDGRVFTWGRNDCHQVSPENSTDQSGPKIITLKDDNRFCDVGCGCYHTLLCTQNMELYYTGKLFIEDSKKLHLLESSDVTITHVSSIEHNILSTSLLSCFIPEYIRYKNFLSIQQRFLEYMLVINSGIVNQIQIKTAEMNVNIYETLCKYFKEILNFSAANLLSLKKFSKNHISECDIVIIKYFEEHLSIYKLYLNALCDIISLGSFNRISHTMTISNQISDMFSDYLQSKNIKKTSEAILFECFNYPLRKVNDIKKFISSLNISDRSLNTKITVAIKSWDSFIDELIVRKREAETTKHFWESSGKVLELLRSPERRLVKDSKTDPILYLNSSRFSSHWFILLTDMFVHMIGTTQSIHNLETIWVQPQQEPEHAISITMPEENFILYSTTSQVKSEWLQALQNTIKMHLKKTNLLQPPAMRTASYSFTKNSFFKGAKYTGRWLNGKMHGTGHLKWPDGKKYYGQFQNNQMHGYGRMDIPNIGIYEGQWEENIQCGLGALSYQSGDIYEGNFENGVPHGHGMLKSGHFTASSASVYIGEWKNGQKSGYGIMDNISAGQKYLGMWNDNKKHGNGVIVTLDGMYYEGEFSQDSLSGLGIMIHEDGTHYEGEFQNINVLNGKGILTLQTGDRIEGTLNGSVNEDIKITNAVLKLKQPDDKPHELESLNFAKYSVPSNQRWNTIFKQCYRKLGIQENTKIDRTIISKIWENVAVFISNSQQIIRVNGKSKSNDDISGNDRLTTIPQFGCESIDLKSFNDIKEYLVKAFACSHHPLSSLLSDLTMAYTASYGGVRVHPLLLKHAIAELRSITERIYTIVRLLFPALPLPKNELVFTTEKEETNVSIATLLHPIVLPKLHSTLFVLYSLHNKKDDDLYWKKLIKWNKESDSSLMVSLEIDKKFFMNVSPNDNSVSLQSRYTKSIETLQQLKTTFTPYEKLFVIKQTFKTMTCVIQDILGTSYYWTMDDLFPLFLFIVIRSRILQLGSEINFIEDFMEPHLENGEMDVMFTTLKASYYQILQENKSTNI